MVPAPPPPVELPSSVVAIVVDVRGGTERITRPEFGHALAQAAAQAGRGRAPKPGVGGYGKLKAIALKEMFEVVWIQGQAGEMGIGVSKRQIARAVAQVKREAFKDGAEYRHFLREAHYTRRDVSERVEVQLLSTRIVERVLLGIRGASAERKALSKFVTEYEERWRARTVCAPGYLINRCSNSSAP